MAEVWLRGLDFFQRAHLDYFQLFKRIGVTYLLYRHVKQISKHYISCFQSFSFVSHGSSSKKGDVLTEELLS